MLGISIPHIIPSNMASFQTARSRRRRQRSWGEIRSKTHHSFELLGLRISGPFSVALDASAITSLHWQMHDMAYKFNESDRKCFSDRTMYLSVSKGRSMSYFCAAATIAHVSGLYDLIGGIVVVG